METLLTIPKEQVANLSFISQDVLSSPQLQDLRKNKLQRAMLLGNLYRVKVTIKFRDDLHRFHCVDTTIWAVFEEHVSIKSGATIPIRAIEDIEF